jgi:hypothetical protein
MKENRVQVRRAIDIFQARPGLSYRITIYQERIGDDDIGRYVESQKSETVLTIESDCLTITLGEEAVEQLLPLLKEWYPEQLQLPDA